MLRLKTAAVQTSGQKIDRPHAVSSAPILLRLHECRNIFPSRIVHLYRYNRTRRRHLKNDTRTREKTWENNRANLDEGRRRAIHDYNLMRNFARLAREAMAMDEAIEKPIRPWSFVPNGRCGRKKALVARLPDLSCAERYSSLIRKLSFGFPGSCVT
jgi:hypothetical protein